MKSNKNEIKLNKKTKKRILKTKYRQLKNKLKNKRILDVEKKKINNRKDLSPTKELKISIKNKLKYIKKLNKNPKGKTKINNSLGNIMDVHDLEKIYITGNTIFTALKNVNISIKKGDIAIILGPSGSGKTTLLNVLSGLDRATNGEIIVNNINLSSLTTNELTSFRRENVGFIFQSYNLLPSLTARDNAEIGAALQSDANKRISVEEIFKKMNMSDLIDSNIKNLSGGQQQRVSIARALAKNPNIIFADEPTGALDTITAKKILKLLLYINKKYKTTIIFVTHNESIKKIATKIINVIDGEVSG